jgi:F-type H+-transporting ATPase subunit delta
MKVSELASRYAKAAFELALENKVQDKVLEDLRTLDQAFKGDHDIHEFLVNPLIKSEQRIKVLHGVLDGKGFSREVMDLLSLLAKKDRFHAFHEIVHAFELLVDASHNVIRGTVRSAAELGPNERKQIEEKVEAVLKKKVIMTYKIDSSVIGGLIAQVGSYTFDDTLASHLRRMNEELKRRS